MSHKPELLGFTRRGQIMAATGQLTKKDTLQDAGAKTLSGTTQHWQSVYGQANDVTTTQHPNPSYRPLWSINR